MNDLEELDELRAFRGDVPEPGADRLAPGRERLLRAARGGRSRPRFRLPAVRLAVAAGAAVAVGAAGTFAVVRDGPPPADVRPVSATVFLERAAEAAERAPDRRPADDQWVYTKVVFPPPKEARRARPAGHREQWVRFDGLKSAYAAPIAGPDEKLEIVDNDHQETYGTDSEERTPAEWYDYLRGLPSEPSALLAAVYRRHDAYVRETGGERFPQGRDQWVFWRLADYLSRGAVVPAAARATIYRAIARIPDVRVRRGVADAMGRSGTAVVRTGADDVREEVVIADGTYAYLGTRMVNTVLKTPPPFKGDGRGPGPPREPIRAGAVLSDHALAVSAVVDEPGVRP
ncbi:CU044_5270 family protein [Actinomadura sediminis]|uniref:CU044_5270 family protein n=1 Tax=Actinomadura sediminis TaxID=1038904 RepID=A0ABW3EP49_9ACTN